MTSDSSVQGAQGEVVGATCFGAAIKSAREKRRMSFQEVGDAAGISKAHAWELEVGRARNPSIKTIMGLANALVINPTKLATLALRSLDASPHPSRPGTSRR